MAVRAGWVACWHAEGVTLTLGRCTAVCGQASAAIGSGLPYYPVLSGPVLSGPVLSGPVLSGPVLSGPVLSGPVLSGPVLELMPGGLPLAQLY
jgi:hypothetical protein